MYDESAKLPTEQIQIYYASVSFIKYTSFVHNTLGLHLLNEIRKKLVLARGVEYCKNRE